MGAVEAAESTGYNKRFVDLAIRLAARSKHHSYLFGALVVKKRTIVAASENADYTHPQSPHPRKTLHAEAAAIIKALNTCTSLQRCDLYVARVSRSKKRVSAASPCQYCLDLIRRAGIRKVIHTDYGTRPVKVIHVNG